MTDPMLDNLLGELGSTEQCPPPSAELALQLDEMSAAPARRPTRQVAAVIGISLAYVGALLVALKLRRDLSYLPRTWLVLYCAAWAVSSFTLLWLAIVPARQTVMPRWRIAALAAGVATFGFVMAGLMLPRSVPGLSSIYPETARDLVSHSRWCLQWGSITAIVPIAVGILVLRRALPVGARRAGLALGAGGGALGGLLLHLHCPITDRLHLGLVHGGVMVIAAVLAALIAPRYLRP